MAVPGIVYDAICRTPCEIVVRMKKEQHIDLSPAERAQSEALFQAWVDCVYWQFAKTYAKKAPHEYTLVDWKPELAGTFRDIAAFIRAHGQIDPYHGHPFTVYYLNGWKYWDMDGLINRTREEWCTQFNLTWNPPAWFNPAPSSSGGQAPSTKDG